MTPRAIAASRPIGHLPRLHPLRLLRSMMSLRRQRRALAQLDDHLLHDIGITREEARTEAARPVWDVPAHWRRCD
ncbi:MAG: DUF1127 domain-containing protein [Rhodobacteraceae bacterium]|nr:DUF1127 domain-containing protein [Paracoccaceae bacterium]